MTDKDIIEIWLKGRLADLYEESQCEVPELPKEVIEGQMLVLRETLSFIDSLPAQEKGPLSEDLEKAANEWNAKALDTPFYMTLDDNGNPNGVRQDYTTHAESFKAGAKWGRNQAMAEIQAQSMALAHGCPKEPVNEELVETAKSYVETHVFGTEKFTCQVATDMFISGAQWQKQKTVDKACKWIDENAAKYLVDRFVESTRIVGIDASILVDFRKDIEDEIQSKV